MKWKNNSPAQEWLREIWNAVVDGRPITAEEIARQASIEFRENISEKAIAGAAYSIGLKRRSPENSSKRVAETSANAIPSVPRGKSTLPPLLSETPEEILKTYEAGETNPDESAHSQLVENSIPGQPTVTHEFRDNANLCCWPLGEPGTRNFRYCDDPTPTRGKPYCEAHAQRAYTRKQDPA